MYCSTSSSPMVASGPKNSASRSHSDAHVARVVLHHVQDVFHRLGDDGDLPLPEEARHPALLLVVEHLPEDLLAASLGTAAMIFLSMSPANPALRRRRVASAAGAAAVLHERRHLLRALDLLHVRQDHEAVAREEGLVAQAEHDVRHAGSPRRRNGVTSGCSPDAAAMPSLDLVSTKCRLLPFLGTEEQSDGRLTRGRRFCGRAGLTCSFS